jgi:hypothetical protein
VGGSVAIYHTLLQFTTHFLVGVNHGVGTLVHWYIGNNIPNVKFNHKVNDSHVVTSRYHDIRHLGIMMYNT